VLLPYSIEHHGAMCRLFNSNCIICNQPIRMRCISLDAAECHCNRSSESGSLRASCRSMISGRERSQPELDIYRARHHPWNACHDDPSGLHVAL